MSPLAEQLFGMYNIHTHHIVFELSVMEKKKDESNEINKIENFMFGFHHLVKG